MRLPNRNVLGGTARSACITARTGRSSGIKILGIAIGAILAARRITVYGEFRSVFREKKQCAVLSLQLSD